jgi:hypothetical protein
MFIPVRWCWFACVSLGCTTLAGIDEEYVGRDGSAGVSGEGAGPNAGSAGVGGSVGGSLGRGGTTGSGGTNGSGGINGSAGTSGTAGAGGTADAGCPQGQKRCATACVTPAVGNGCSLSGCEPCPEPTVLNMVVSCSVNTCFAECALGYVPNQGQCVQGTGGSGGTSGTGGSAGSGGSGACTPAGCPPCPGVSCCTARGQCGCQHGVPPFVNPYCIEN